MAVFGLAKRHAVEGMSMQRQVAFRSFFPENSLESSPVAAYTFRGRRSWRFLLSRGPACEAFGPFLF